MLTKVCPTCKKEKSVDEFRKNRTKKDGLSSLCKGCQSRIEKEWSNRNKDRRSLTNKRWRIENPEKRKESRKRYYKNHPEKRSAKRFGFSITSKEYNDMVEKQNGKCAICGKPDKVKRRLAIDHDHTNNKVRGLLCSTCNLAIGLLGDSIQILESAISYLKK